MQKPKKDFRKFNGGEREGAGRPNPYTSVIVSKNISIPLDAIEELNEAVKAIRLRHLKKQVDFSKNE